MVKPLLLGSQQGQPHRFYLGGEGVWPPSPGGAGPQLGGTGETVSDHNAPLWRDHTRPETCRKAPAAMRRGHKTVRLSGVLAALRVQGKGERGGGFAVLGLWVTVH